ncbi:MULTISPECIES: bifunctional hydroxymethylpyrimidine kinase/phosphomethylpyrimidine kinase [unclassified Francisella]|uniref:bifunctional hydroxymethylpyrimidine kinase/phosphomethylpyrimidine kinase n=1 Tax=unclassified Francisella TaxID=2610885 RepID=UPI002E3196A1|nr:MULTISPECIES: bifunctional hydroxymethylpyrimidine kinase/phosphomethylpyrimidine kinase [unclassified Francisella]MED7819865.1 bifunctional hydroxymethylpyrimidine kinase/phosphomethylpyrimidine kinase [Francisella sp. 19S2-4]MED7830671.1 bifunctional hydroxymethylpyrimidine kinase/phosphomethylpyrimidine kinase [Francisella sp. 19S2-10]
MKDIFLTVGGSDSSSGAGIQADIKTASDIGVNIATVVSCVTAQNSMTILDIQEVSANNFSQQLNAIVDDFHIKVIKSSVLVSIEQIGILINFIKTFKEVIYICDPIMFSTTGKQLVSRGVVEYARLNLYPLADILTPNLDEAKILLGDTDFSVLGSLYNIAEAIQKKYHCKNVFLKGGHSIEKNVCTDFYYSNNDFNYSLVSSKYKKSTRIRGTGCTLSSAVASFLVQGFDINNSLVLAKSYITNAIKNSQKITITANHLAIKDSLNFNSDFPRIYFDKAFSSLKFRSINKVGFYPIVDDADKIPRLAKLGVKTIQLRIKAKDIAYVEKNIVKAIEYQNKYQLQLFINDYYQLAIKHSAFGIHLGHEDLLDLFHTDGETLFKISKSNIALGLSTHDYYELAIALAIKPSYIALGPIYPTTTKQMKFKPQGLSKIHQWLDILDVPLVAIGGIKKEHFKAIKNIGVNGVSVVSLVDEISDRELEEIVKFLE